MRILFLDIDGVILPFDPDSFDVPRECARRINILCREFGLKVVISSSWRSDAVKAADWRVAHTVHEWTGKYHWLRSVVGLDVEVIGVTPLFGNPNVVEPGVRGQEIMGWMAEHPEVTDWVVVDDFAVWLGPDVMHRAVITEQQKTGFDEDALNRARELFA